MVPVAQQDGAKGGGTFNVCVVLSISTVIILMFFVFGFRWVQGNCVIEI